MSALGQKRTSGGRLGHVRFSPESGHPPADLGMSALCQYRPKRAAAKIARFPETEVELSIVRLIGTDWGAVLDRKCDQPK